MQSVALALSAVLLLSSPVRAWTGEVAWPTFLRTGPGQRFTVSDELLRGARVEVGDCDVQWCRVQLDRTTGFMDRTALAARDATPPPVAGPEDCFEARRAGRARGEVWRYCVRAGKAAAPE